MKKSIINTINDEEIINKLTEFAVEASLCEVSCFPSPGLVSPISKGAHEDMNFYTFIESTTSLIKFFSKFAKIGLENSEEDIFILIKDVGIKAEEEMFRKTKGVNTQKGLLFILGISIVSSAFVMKKGKNFEEIREVIKTITKGIVKRDLINLDKNKKITHGEEIYLKYKIEGIRGEVEKGLPIVFEYSLEIIEKNDFMTINDKLLHTLLYIMKELDDTNIIYRHSMETLFYIKERSSYIIKKGGINTKEGREELKIFDEELIEKNISPGGSADILAVTYFFNLLKNYMGGKYDI